MKNNTPQTLEKTSFEHDAMTQIFEGAIDLAKEDDEAFLMKREGNIIYIDSWYDSKKVKYVFENEEQAKNVEERALKIAEALEYLYFDLSAFELALKTTYNVVTDKCDC